MATTNAEEPLTNITGSWLENPNGTFANSTLGQNRTDNPFLTEVFSYTIYWIGVNINLRATYIITGIGIPGNVVIVATLSTLRPVLSAYVYMMVLAVFDSVSLIVKSAFMVSWVKVCLKGIRHTL